MEGKETYWQTSTVVLQNRFRQSASVSINAGQSLSGPPSFRPMSTPPLLLNARDSQNKVQHGQLFPPFRVRMFRRALSALTHEEGFVRRSVSQAPYFQQ